MTISEIVAGIGTALPPVAPPAALYRTSILSGPFLYLAGQVSRDECGEVFCGKLGEDLSVEQGREAARLSALHLISQIDHAIGGDLGKLVRIVKLTGFVNATADFCQHSLVIDAASALMVDVFGDAGAHSRSAIGVASLPRGAAVEIEAVVQIKNSDD